MTLEIPASIDAIYQRSVCLYTQQAVETALDELAQAISEQLSEQNPLLLCVMIGGLVPMGNLMVRLNFPLSLDYVHATRYQGTITGQTLEWKSYPCCPIAGRTVLIVDDILDSGITLAAIVEHCQKAGAKAVYTAVLVNKQRQRPPAGLQQADFSALTVADHYVFGYGLDYREYLRNAPGIFALPKDCE